MSFSINTNIASLESQNYLRINSDFQHKTIGRVTSGLRITSSGDDAAGLAIANGYRSDESVLTQGIRNANDGLSQLQIADGGLNNISQLLDRARTLATQSASGTFTGDRTILNSEFQSVLTEIDRQSQAIGLNTSGIFAKNLSVFIGGGRTSNGVTGITNGSVSVDLSQSTVDSKSLGLKGVQSLGTALTDIGANGSNATSGSSTSVSSILTNATNTGSEAVAGNTTFYVSGPGFGGANKIAVSVATAGVTDTGTLVAAINSAIANAGNGGTQAGTAFKNANITASVNVDASGKSQLTFNSAGSAFQVQAGDRVANALLGNFDTSANNSTGKSLANATTATASDSTGTDTFTNTNVIVRIQGSGLAAPVDIQLNTGSGATVTQTLASLTSQVANNAALQAAGISLNSVVAGGTIAFTSNRGEQFTVSAANDVQNRLGLGTYSLATSGSTSYDYTTITAGFAATAATTKTDTLEVSVGGGAAVSLSVTSVAADTASTLNDKLNTAIQAAGTSLQNAGLYATVSAGVITLQSSNGTAFRVNDSAGATNAILGFGVTIANGTGVTNGANSVRASVATDLTNNVHYDSGGASASKALLFNAIQNGSDTQTLSFSALDSAGAAHSTSVVLQNNATARNARSLDEALSTINNALQKTNDTTLQKIAAVKEYDTTAHTEGIKFVSTLGSFSVGVGTVGSSTSGSPVGVGSAGANGDQGTIVSSAVSNGGSTADITSQSTAQAAVNALAVSVASLGKAQAVVGRGENQFNFAVNLAQSQLTNTTTAESRIRDADLASEAANLTKAQILLQAGVAALAQANSAPQAVLALLK
ncbi:MAG: flagellin [Bryobacteraceae bacterium]